MASVSCALSPCRHTGRPFYATASLRSRNPAPRAIVDPSESPTGSRDRNIYLIGRNGPYRRYFGVQTFERDRRFGGARPITHLVGFEEATVAVEMACHMTEDDRLGKAGEYVLDNPNIDFLLLLKLCRHLPMAGEESVLAMESTFLHAISFADAESLCHERGMALTILEANITPDTSQYDTSLTKHYPKYDYKDYAAFLNALWECPENPESSHESEE